MKKFKISADLTESLRKQQTQLSLTTAVSGIGLLFVAAVNMITELNTPENDVFEQPETPEEA